MQRSLRYLGAFFLLPEIKFFALVFACLFVRLAGASFCLISKELKPPQRSVEDGRIYWAVAVINNTLSVIRNWAIRTAKDDGVRWGRYERSCGGVGSFFFHEKLHCTVQGVERGVFVKFKIQFAILSSRRYRLALSTCEPGNGQTKEQFWWKCKYSPER